MNVNNNEPSDLYVATLLNDIEEVKRLLEDPLTNINKQSASAALHGAIALNRNCIEICILLIKDPRIDLNIPDSCGYTILHVATIHNRKEIVQQLLENQFIDINAKGDDGNTALHLAARYMKEEIANLLVRDPGIDLNIKNNNGETASDLGKRICAPNIINIKDAHHNINKNDETVYIKGGNGETSLHKAVKDNETEIVKLLIKNPSTDINVKNNEGFTTLYLAALGGKTEMVELLLNHPHIDVNAKNNHADVKNTHGLTALEAAVIHLHKPIVKLLTEDRRTNVNIWKDYFNVFHKAVEKGEIEIVKLLLKHPCIDVNVKDKDEFTALYLAVLSNKIEMMKLFLKDLRTDINAQNKHGNTALHVAVFKNCIPMVKLLLEDPRADVNVSNNDGKTALDIAKYHDFKEIANLLTEHHLPTNTDNKINCPNHSKKVIVNSPLEHNNNKYIGNTTTPLHHNLRTNIKTNNPAKLPSENDNTETTQKDIRHPENCSKEFAVVGFTSYLLINFSFPTKAPNKALLSTNIHHSINIQPQGQQFFTYKFIINAIFITVLALMIGSLFSKNGSVKT